MREKPASREKHPAQWLSFALSFLLLTGFNLGAGSHTAQAAEAYPVRPIRLIVSSPAGGALDAIGRIVATALGEALGQKIVVDNRPGGGGTVYGNEVAARATPDGYNLLLINAAFSTLPGLLKKLPYDPIKDFAPISLVATSPLVFVVPSSLGVGSIPELISLAKSKPGQLNYGVSQLGSSGHLASALLMWMSGMDMVQISYKGAPQALIDLVSARIHVVCTSPIPAIPYVKAGKLRALAVTSRSRSPVLPDVPAVAESVPGYESTTWYGVLAPAATPPAIIRRLSSELATVVTSPSIVRLLQRRAAIPVGSTPQELSKFLRSEIDRWTKLIEEAKIRAN